MEPAPPTEFDDLDDMPTVPGVYVLPDWAFAAKPDPVLEDPASWDTADDTVVDP